MKHGIYTCVILMAFLALSESVYAVVPVFTIASDTIRRVVIYFDQEETDVDSCYKTNNQEINVLDSLLEERGNVIRMLMSKRLNLLLKEKTGLNFVSWWRRIQTCRTGKKS